MLATTPCSAHALAQARPTMSYIPLVILYSHVKKIQYVQRKHSKRKHTANAGNAANAANTPNTANA